MEALFFVLDIVLMTVLVHGVVRAEKRNGGVVDKDANLGFFAFKSCANDKH